MDLDRVVFQFLLDLEEQQKHVIIFFKKYAGLTLEHCGACIYRKGNLEILNLFESALKFEKK
tara:strand:- start:238742 stop:238927 length:186 start_codon:yes stop_codon:yes gene_type:complete